MKRSIKRRYAMKALLNLTIHQGEEPVLPAEKDHELGIRTRKALQINGGYPQKPKLLARHSQQLQETCHA
jgi:hypothetical protein